MTPTMFKTISDVAAEIGIPYYRIEYAHKVGKLPIPVARWRNQRIYSEEDVQRVREYFERQDEE